MKAVRLKLISYGRPRPPSRRRQYRNSKLSKLCLIFVLQVYKFQFQLFAALIFALFLVHVWVNSIDAASSLFDGGVQAPRSLVHALDSPPTDRVIDRSIIVLRKLADLQHVEAARALIFLVLPVHSSHRARIPSPFNCAATSVQPAGKTNLHELRQLAWLAINKKTNVS